MKDENQTNAVQIHHLLTTLSAKQQTFDFGEIRLWSQLPEHVRQACCEAIAAIIYQVTTETVNNHQPSQENNSNER
jgi:hypothetical protein